MVKQLGDWEKHVTMPTSFLVFIRTKFLDTLTHTKQREMKPGETDRERDAEREGWGESHWTILMGFQLFPNIYFLQLNIQTFPVEPIHFKETDILMVQGLGHVADVAEA